MYSETPFVTALVRELHARELIPVEREGKYPSVDPESEVLHACFYLLQELGHLPVRFRFKGSAAPFSTDLSSVLTEYSRNQDFWAEEAERGVLTELTTTAIERFASLVDDVPEAFIHSPPDKERWWFVLATYRFVETSGLHADSEEFDTQAELLKYFGGALQKDELDAAGKVSASLSDY